MIDEAALWRDMHRAAWAAEEGEAAEEEEDETEGSAVDPDQASTVVVQLENGKFHVCCGAQCPFAEHSEDSEKNLVCTLSGRVIGASIESAHDSSWTGRSCGSADPDMASGAVPSRAWRNKRDAFTESARAYNKAKQMADDDADFSAYATSYAASKSDAAAAAAAAKQAAAEESAKSAATKRGAPCVSHVDQATAAEHKRAKALKRITSLGRRDVQARLIGDAMFVVQKLFSAPPVPAASSGDAVAAAAAEAVQQDPRLENFHFVFAVNLKRYIARCSEDKEPVTLSSLHDVAVASGNFVRERRAESKKRQSQSRMRILCVCTRTSELLSRLIVSIWNALVQTSHFLDSQPGDSFRPFASGILYGLKRGIKLKTGLVVVPIIPELSDQLPTLRSSAGIQDVRQLQASSHKGLCSIHRSISSIDSMTSEERAPVEEKLKIAAQISAGLVEFVRQATSK